MYDEALLLIVEDSLTQAMQLQHTLKQHGFSADMVHNGQQALEYISHKRPTIIISDIVMPQMDGYELCRHIKDDPEFKDIPVILLTALSEPHDIIRGLESGANNFIVKPYDERFLVSRIQYTLANFEIRKGNVSDVGIEIFFGGTRHFISSDRLQVIDLLLSAYETAVEANLELKRTKTNYLSLLESNVDAIVVANLDGSVVFSNPAASRLFDTPRQQMVGQPFDHPVTVGETRDIRFIRSDGRHVTAEMRVVETSWEGQTAYMALLRDMTERVEAEEALVHASEELKKTAERASQLAVVAESANLAKSEFLANVSHEIRTPLNAVIGMTDIMLDTDLTVEQLDYMETVRNSGDLLLTIISDILDFSKVEAGKLEMEHEPFNLRECIEEAILLVASQADDKGLDLVYLMAKNVPEAVVGDITRVRQILANLLSNAVKFTESGEVTVEVRRETQTEDIQTDTLGGSCRLHFTVRDTGIGIPPDRLEGLFHPFSQLDASTTRRYGGTGLGLSISKQLSQMLGGDTWVETQGQQQGATFHFTICVDIEPEQPKPAFLVPESPDLLNRRLFLLEPNPSVRTIISHYGRLWGMHVAATDSPERALEWLRSEPPFDLGILSIPLNDPLTDATSSSLSLANQIRQIRSKDELPLIALVFKRLHQINEGTDLFTVQLAKPVLPAHLHDMMVSVLTHRPMERYRRPEKQIDSDMARRYPLQILLAEDNLVNQKVAKHILGRLGYQADLAATGTQVIEALERQPYDVILMDVQMPEMDGVEATQKVRRDLPPDRQPYIIALTAHALTGHREEYLDAGMDDYISKPVRLEELTTALEKAATSDKKVSR